MLSHISLQSQQYHDSSPQLKVNELQFEFLIEKNKHVTLGNIQRNHQFRYFVGLYS